MSSRSEEIVNEAFFERMMEHMTEGGIWTWIDTGHTYIHSVGRLMANNKEGWQALRSIVGKEWFDSHVYPLGLNLPSAAVAMA
jgi:hypothetical protein